MKNDQMGLGLAFGSEFANLGDPSKRAEKVIVEENAETVVNPLERSLFHAFVHYAETLEEKTTREQQAAKDYESAKQNLVRELEPLPKNIVTTLKSMYTGDTPFKLAAAAFCCLVAAEAELSDKKKKLTFPLDTSAKEIEKSWHKIKKLLTSNPRMAERVLETAAHLPRQIEMKEAAQIKFERH